MEDEDFGIGVGDYLLTPGSHRDGRMFDGHARSMLVSHSSSSSGRDRQ